MAFLTNLTKFPVLTKLRIFRIFGLNEVKDLDSGPAAQGLQSLNEVKLLDSGPA